MEAAVSGGGIGGNNVGSVRQTGHWQSCGRDRGRGKVSVRGKCTEQTSRQAGNREAVKRLGQACLTQQTAQWHRQMRGGHKSSCTGCLAGRQAGGCTWAGSESEVAWTGMLLCETTQGTVAARFWVSSACCCTVFGSGFAPRWLSLLLHCLVSGFGLICCHTAAARATSCVRAGGPNGDQLWTRAALNLVKHAEVLLAGVPAGI